MCEREGKRMKEPKESLCWCCQNAVPSKEKGTGCPWSERFAPVDGWCAFRNVIDNGEGRFTESYCVKSCPLYRADPGAVPSNLSAPKRWKEHEVRRLIHFMQAGSTVADAAKRLGRDTGSVKHRVYRLRKDGKLAPAPSQKKRTVKNKTGTITSCKSKKSAKSRE